MWLLKKFAAILTTLIFVVISLLYFFYYLHSVSVPNEYENLETGHLRTEVNIFSHSAGIKEIVANNETDAYFAIGYIQAQDRMFQMDIMRRTARGELSEIYGKKFLYFDKFMRTLKLKEIASKNTKLTNKHVKILLKNYCDGINFYLNKNKDRLHFAFSALNYFPEKWSVEDCYLIERLFAYQMSVAFRYDVNFGNIAELIGIDKTMKLLPNFEQYASFIYDDLQNDTTKLKKKKKIASNNFTKSIEYTKIMDNLNNLLRDSIYKSMILAKTFGCNAWAMKKIQASKSSAILANDFHSELTIPSLWYQTIVSYPGTNLVGYSIPGIPFLFAGRNDKVAWGLSNAMIDDCDYFIEKKSINCDCYISSDGNTKDFIYQKDTIKIANSEIYQYYLQSTHNSPVINNNLKINEIYHDNSNNESKPEIFKKYILSYRWTGSYASDELTTLYMLTQVSNWEEFKFSFGNWKSPCMNFVYADNLGNIGLLTAGSIPKRAEMNNMVLPNPGWLKEYQWYGLDTSGVLLSMFNPKKNYVFAANNPLIRNKKLSEYFDISSRAKRIEELIMQYQATENYVVGAVDMQRMQTDILSDYSRQLLSVVKPVIENNLETLTELELKAYKILKNWDYLYSKKTNAPLIMNMFIKNLSEQVFQKELGKKAFKYYMEIPQFAMMKTFELLNEDNNTNKVDSLSVKEKTRIYTIMISFKSAVDSLKNIFGNIDINNWQYGELHILKFHLPFRIFNFLKPVYKVDIIKMGGDISTINYSSWNYFEPFKVVSSVSMRLICDLSEQSVYYSLPGGVSEDPINPSFKSQLHLWENGANLKINYNNRNLKGKLKILTLN